MEKPKNKNKHEKRWTSWDWHHVKCAITRLHDAPTELVQAIVVNDLTQDWLISTFWPVRACQLNWMMVSVANLANTKTKYGHLGQYQKKYGHLGQYKRKIMAIWQPPRSPIIRKFTDDKYMFTRWQERIRGYRNQTDWKWCNLLKAFFSSNFHQTSFTSHIFKANHFYLQQYEYWRKQIFPGRSVKQLHHITLVKIVIEFREDLL